MLTRRMLCASGFAFAACNAGAQTPLHMTAPRATHTVVAMKDGSVLFLGGCDSGGCDTATATVDRYDPATGSIRQIGRLTGSRVQAAAMLLPDHTILLAGGWIDGSATANVERFDPGTGQSREIGKMSVAQPVTTITLQDERIALMGEKAVDVFDPAADRLAPLTAASQYLEGGSATPLTSGKVLVAGGGVTRAGPRAGAFLFDPASGGFTPTASLLAERCKHAAVRLADGRVLIVGGSDRRGRDGGKYREMEAYDPATGRFSVVGQTQEARFKIPDAAVLLKNGKVLVAGGATYPELIDPSDWSVRRVDVELGATLNFSTTVALPNGDVLVAGGYSERTIKPTDQVWIIPAGKLA